MKNDTALCSYLLAPTQEEEVVELCSEESPEERELIKRPRQGCDEGRFQRALPLPWNRRYSLQLHCRVYGPFLHQSEQVVEKGGHDYSEGVEIKGVCVMCCSQ